MVKKTLADLPKSNLLSEEIIRKFKGLFIKRDNCELLLKRSKDKQFTFSEKLEKINTEIEFMKIQYPNLEKHLL